MATKTFNLRQCHKSMAWTPKFQYGPFQAPYRHCRSNSTDTEHEPEPESTGPEDHPPKTKLWEFVLRNDGRLGSLEKQVKDVEIGRYQATNQIDSRMNKGFSDVKSNFSEVERNFSEVKRTFDRLEAKLDFIQWQLALLGAAIVGFFSLVGCWGKKLMDIHIPQIAPDIRRVPTTGGTGNSSSGTGKG
ncbi:hypothetical protein HOY80DRAFT_1052200 [Tuber brumale]|nr:hypothetical protein HOY80DRAFT_1052200 [Tuber brumale]